MGMDNEGIVNRRQLLVKVGSLMKISWRKSKERLLDDDDNELSNTCRRGRRKRERNSMVMFDDDVVEIPNHCNGSIPEDEIKKRWYQSDDYCRFKKDTILNSLNYINARRASKPFNETKNCIRGIETMCMNPKLRQRYTAEKRYVYKVIRDEQTRQRKEQQQKRNQQNETIEVNTKRNSSSYPDLERFRSISLPYTKSSRDRAIARGNEYARSQHGSSGPLRSRSPSMKNLFRAAYRSPSTAAVM